MVNRTENLDKILLSFHFNEVHSITINNDCKSVWKALNQTDFLKSFVIRTLFYLRGMWTKTATLEDCKKFFKPVLIKENEEIIMSNSIRSFWGSCTIAWSFRLEKITVSSTELFTETRIYLPTRKDYYAFRCYWLVIEPFSKLIRRIMLRLVRSEAEKDNRVLDTVKK